MRQEPPDLVIVDIEMPVMNGFEFLDRLGKDKELQASKAIVCSAFISQTDRQRALRAGALDFLPKPVEIEELLNCLALQLKLEWIEYLTCQPAEETLETIVPPRETIEKLLTIAPAGDTRGVREKLGNLVHADSSYQAFAEPLLQLTRSFKIEEIERILRTHLI